MRGFKAPKPLFGDEIWLAALQNIETRGGFVNALGFIVGGPWAPFENWHLKEDYKKAAKRQEMAAALRKHITWIAFINLMFCPLILVFQTLYNCFIYSEVMATSIGQLRGQFIFRGLYPFPWFCRWLRGIYLRLELAVGLIMAGWRWGILTNWTMSSTLALTERGSRRTCIWLRMHRQLLCPLPGRLALGILASAHLNYLS